MDFADETVADYPYAKFCVHCYLPRLCVQEARKYRHVKICAIPLYSRENKLSSLFFALFRRHSGLYLHAESSCYSRSSRIGFILAAAGVWIINLIDIYFIVKKKDKKEKNLRLKFNLNENKNLAFTISYSF